MMQFDPDFDKTTAVHLWGSASLQIDRRLSAHERPVHARRASVCLQVSDVLLSLQPTGSDIAHYTTCLS